MFGKLFLSIVIAMALVVPVAADISTTGDAVYAGAVPGDLTLDAVKSDAEFYVFAERQAVTLGSDLTVDITQDYLYNDSGDLTGRGGTILSGTVVNSYLIHADPVTNSGPLILYDGSITFGHPILGVIVQTSTLNATDGILGGSTTTYYTGVNRGLELNTVPQDILDLDLLTNTITLHLESGNIIDNIRVIEAVPVPAAVLLGMLGLGAAGLKLRKYV